MKKRYLLILLAVIAAVLLLVLPGAALATQYVTLPGDGNTVWFDLDTNQSVFQGQDTDLTYYASPAEYANFNFVLRGSGFFTTVADYDAIGWTDVFSGALGVEPQAGIMTAPYSFVVITKSGTCFKGLVTAIDVCVLLYQQLAPPNDPPTLLSDLKDFIAAPTSGVDPVIGTSLTAKANAALAALDRGKTKTAINNLNALLNQVRAQTGKKITQQAADEINSQVNAIIAAINQS